jgi:hypothetical protein
MPKWLSTSREIDEIGRRRCLMILSVLSGERPVSDVVAEAKITRPLYYQLEEKALVAMLEAVTPGAAAHGRESTTSSGRIRALEDRVKRLEKEKRRLEHLLLLTRKVLRPGPMKTRAGRRAKTTSPSAYSSTTNGKRASKSSSSRASTIIPAGSPKGTTSSTPTKDGGAEL